MTTTTSRITFIFIFLGIYPFSLVQAVEPIDCDPEPTDMTIQYGDFLDGSNCSIASGDTDIFRFTAGVGERILVRGSDQSGSNSINVCVQLLDPDGLPTSNGADACTNVNRQIDELVMKSGVHTILVREAGAFPMAYGLVLERVAPPSLSAELLCFGCTIDDAISTGGDVDLYTFLGTPGDVIQLQGSDQSGSNSINVCVELLDPDGLPTLNGTMACGNVTRQIDETIEKEGIHTVIVRDSGVFPMSYSINLQCLVGPCRNFTPPVCDIQLSQETYTDGETVTADVLRVANLTGASLALEWKLWLGVPGVSPIEVANQGGDGSLVLTDGTDVDLRPGSVPWLFLPVTAALSRGEYELSCRFLNPTTGRLLMEDRNFFDLQ